MRGCKVGGAFLAVAMLMAACGGDGDESTKGGGSSAPVTLRIGTDDWPGRPSADMIEEFARRVEDRSDGQLRIEPVWRAAASNRSN
jgi:TRAP-type C4-dicarboxylate transport system substrate-binding protein